MNTDLKQHSLKEKELIAKRLKQAIKDAKAGRVYSTTEVFGEIVKNPVHKESSTVEKKSIRIANSMLFAMNSLQKDMKGEAEKTELTTDESAVELIKHMRKEQGNSEEK